MIKPRLRYPRSFTALLLIGFFLVALPLLGGMLNTAYMLEKIVREGRRSVELTVETTRATRQLAETIVALQRAAGQYYVLEDPTLAETLMGPHKDFHAAAATLSALPLDPNQRQQLAELSKTESGLFDRLTSGVSPKARRFEDFDPAFEKLHRETAEMITQGNRLIDRQAGALSKAADSARQGLIWQGLAMIPLSLFLAGLFSWLISRPLKQLARMIRRLGENDLGAPPPVEGPRDLVHLGEQVDWLRRRLVALEAQQLNFLRQVSHELKTPLAALKEGVDLLADGVAGEMRPQQMEIAQIMRSNTRDLQRRIEELLNYSRAVKEPMALTTVPLSVEDLLAATLRRQELALRAKRLQISATVSGVTVWGDQARLETVFDNLLANAIRFSPDAGSITVKAHTAGSSTEIVVCDAGPGIAPEDRPYVFQPFYQGRIQSPGPLRGSGLGLAIVKEYAEVHGGEISLLDGNGGGACFCLRLPGQGGLKDED